MGRHEGPKALISERTPRQTEREEKVRKGGRRKGEERKGSEEGGQSGKSEEREGRCESRKLKKFKGRLE